MKRTFSEMSDELKFLYLQDQWHKYVIRELPGQPQQIHMGTSYMINDMMQYISELRAEIAELNLK